MFNTIQLMKSSSSPLDYLSLHAPLYITMLQVIMHITSIGSRIPVEPLNPFVPGLHIHSKEGGTRSCTRPPP